MFTEIFVDGSVLDIKFYGELVRESDFSKELLEELLNGGYAVEQLLNGEKYIRMTELYYKDLGEYIVAHPTELCKEYWDRIVEDTQYNDIMSFIKRLCETHSLIKKITKNKVDFCEIIGEELC